MDLLRSRFSNATLLCRSRMSPRARDPRVGAIPCAVHHRHHRLRALDHLRRRTRALDGLRHLPARRAERRDHARADHGPRRGPQRRPLLRDGDRRGVSRRRARQHDHHRAALHRRRRDKPARERSDVARAAATAGARGGMSPTQSDALVVRLRRRDRAQARRQEDLPEPHEDRRRRTLGRRPVRDALRDGEQGARHARA